MPGPIFLENETVELRPIEPEDAEFFAETINDPRVRSGLSMVDPVSVSGEEEWIESLSDEDGVHLVVAVEGDPVATVGLNHVHQRFGTAELGYYVAAEHHGQGYATAASRLLLRHAFDERGMHRITAKAFATNEGSRRVLEKVGFREEGRLREDAFVDGERVDTIVHGILAEEFEG
ncbi:MAG: GNAT family protein [Haloarculaceae archaeon]